MGACCAGENRASSFNEAMNRNGIKGMRVILTVFMVFLPMFSHAGSLFEFDKNLVQINGLNWIQSRYGELTKKELKQETMQVRLNRKGDLEANVFFSYKAENANGILFVCARVDENGKLLNIQKNIEARKPFNLGYVPNSPGCWGKL